MKIRVKNQLSYAKTKTHVLHGKIDGDTIIVGKWTEDLDSDNVGMFSIISGDGKSFINGDKCLYDDAFNNIVSALALNHDVLVEDENGD